MKNRRYALITVHLLLLASFCQAQNTGIDQRSAEFAEKPKGYVTDNAGILNSDEELLINDRLYRLDKTGIAQMIVYVQQTYGNNTLEEYTYKLANHWGIGNRETNNGIIIFVFTSERAIRIEVGIGMERIVTDYFAGQIIDKDMVPAFRESKYGYGLIQAVDHLILEILLRYYESKGIN